MSKVIEFANGFRAELIENSFSNESVARLYSPTDVFLASVPSDIEHFHATADGLLSGYFSGWRDCKRKLSEAVVNACNQEIMQV